VTQYYFFISLEKISTLRILDSHSLKQPAITLLKHKFANSPLSISMLNFILLTNIFAICIGNLERHNVNNDFSYFHSLYFTVITVTTVGYGDYTPLSYSGRFLSLLMMIFGIINVNLINYSFVALIDSSKKEELAITEFEMVQNREMYQRKLIRFTKYFRRV